MQSLPPFRLAPYFRPRIWGFHDLSPWFDYKTDSEPVGEVWLTGDMCPAETGPFAGTPLMDIALQHSEALLGRSQERAQFPLLIKILFPKEKLSVQVHPDDAMAQKYGEPRGKTECWYALDAGPGAHVALGIKPGYSPDEVRKAIGDATLEDLLEIVPVARGDMIFVDAGTVHAVGPDAVLLETQQNSDLTYRMYDYGRPRELHVDLSIEAMRLKTDAGKVAPVAENRHQRLIETKYFRIERFPLDGRQRQDTLKPRTGQMEILFVASGGAKLFGDGFEPFTLERCQVVVVPAASTAWELAPDGEAEVIRIAPR